MSNISIRSIRLKWADSLGISSAQTHSYRMAGSVLVADWPVNLLKSLELTRFEAATLAERDVPEHHAELEKAGSVVRVKGWIAGEIREITSRADRQTYVFDIDGIGQFSVARSGHTIRCDELAAGLSVETVEEALLGPPLVFALALRGIWCLHASAVLMQDRASLFLGPSGSGKSTLSRYFDQAADQVAERIADDMLPCSVLNGRAEVWPHFPQLKLSPSQTYALESPQQLPLRSLVILDAVAGDRESSIESVHPTAAIRDLAGQTVAANLFDRQLHTLHLRFLASLVEATPVFRLLYPHDLAQLPAIAAELARLD